MAAPADDRVGRMEFMLALRQRGIMNAAVLRAMDEVPREHFVPNEFYEQAYAEQALPLACGQTISQPYLVALMTEKLDLAPQHKVLEVGTGSGYQAAVLSRIAREVVTVERYRTLADAARSRLQTLGMTNITVLLADALAGVPEHAPYDRILVTAAAETVPEPLIEQLAGGGIMVLPLGPPQEVQQLVRLTRTAEGLRRDILMPVRFAPFVPGQAREL